MMEGHYRTQKAGGASNPLEKGKQFISADNVKSLGQVDEGQV